MTCDKCKDIHTAQSCGFTVKPCECDCHYSTISTSGSSFYFNISGVTK